MRFRPWIGAACLAALAALGFLAPAAPTLTAAPTVVSVTNDAGEVMGLSLPAAGATYAGVVPVQLTYDGRALGASAAYPSDVIVWVDGVLIGARSGMSGTVNDYVYPIGDGNPSRLYYPNSDGTYTYRCGGTKLVNGAWQPAANGIDPALFELADGTHTLVVQFRSGRANGPLAGTLTTTFTTANPGLAFPARPSTLPFLGVGEARNQPSYTAYANGAAPTAGPPIQFTGDPGTRFRKVNGFPQVTALSTGVPHLSADGVVRTTYEPGKSLLVRGMFDADWSEVEADPNFAPAAKAAGVNVLRGGFFFNPAGWGASAPTSAQDYYANNWLPQVQAHIFPQLAAGPFFAYGHFDDLLRVDGGKWFTTTPWARDAVALVVKDLAGRGVVTGIGMVDETDFVIGSDPTTNPARLAYQTFQRVPGHPPIAWPGEMAFNYETPDYSDFANRFWTLYLDTFRAGPADAVGGPYMTNDQIRRQMERSAGLYDFRSPQQERPLVFNGWLGMSYVKRSAGAVYNPAAGDVVYDQNGGVRPDQLPMQVWTAWALKAGGIVFYNYDQKAYIAARQAGAFPQTDGGWWDQGCNYPGAATPVRPDLWNALAAGFTSTADYEQLLLQPYAEAYDWGRHFVPGHRKGPAGEIAWFVNATDAAQPARTPPAFAVKIELVTGAGRQVLATTPAAVPPGGVLVYSTAVTPAAQTRLPPVAGPPAPPVKADLRTLPKPPPRGKRRPSLPLWGKA